MNYKSNNSYQRKSTVVPIKDCEYCYMFPAIVELSEYLGNWKLILIYNNINQKKTVFISKKNKIVI
jgi:hypothetical protein